MLEQELSESRVGELSKEEIIGIVNQCRNESLARELSERNQQFANSLGINRMSGETVDTDKEDDAKGKDENP